MSVDPLPGPAGGGAGHGAARCVFGRCGLCEALLFDGDYIGITLPDLAPSVTEAAIRALVLPLSGEPRALHLFSSGSGGSQFCRVTLVSKEAAQRALEGLAGELIGGRPIRANPAGIGIGIGSGAAGGGGEGTACSAAVGAGEVDARLVMTWATAPSLGEASLDYASREAAAAALARLTAGGAAPFHPGVSVSVSQESRLHLAQLPVSADEDDVAAYVSYLKAAAGLKRRPTIARRASAPASGAGAGDAGLGLGGDLFLLQSCAPLGSTDCTSFFLEAQSRAGFVLMYATPEEALAAAAEWRRIQASGGARGEGAGEGFF